MALMLVNMPANAGIWDSITAYFSGSEESQPAAAAPAVEKPNMVATGLKLIPLLTSALGVNSGQAEGGMGALLQAAQSLMSGTDFGKLAAAIPNTGALIGAAPAAKDESSGLLGSAMKIAGEHSSSAKAGLDLVSQFKSLGMGAEMIPKFTGVAEDFLADSGSPELGSLFKSVLSSI